MGVEAPFHDTGCTKDYGRSRDTSEPARRLAGRGDRRLLRTLADHRLGLFGSVFREDFGPDSDVDILARFHPAAKHTLLDQVRMEDELESILGRDVDLLSWRGVERSRNRYRRRAILGSVEVVYDA